MVVDADVENLEAGAEAALLMGAGNARADAVEATEPVASRWSRSPGAAYS